MRILFFTGTYKPSVNGVSISTEVLVKNLIKLGHKVLIVAPKNNDIKKEPSYILRYPSLPNPMVKDYPIPLLPLTPAIYSKITKFKPNVVHTHHPYHIGFFANFVAETLKIPLVFTYHTKHDYYATKYFKFLPNDLKKKFIQFSVLDFCKKCRLVIAPSETIQGYLNKNKIRKTAIVPSVVDDLKKPKFTKLTLRKKLNLPVNKIILLYVGRLAAEKSPMLLLNSLKFLDKNYHLVICGSGPIEENMKKKVNFLDLKKQVSFIGSVNRENLGNYYAMADYLYYASKSETQGVVYWEALHFGLPIVSVTSSVAKEWVNPKIGELTDNKPNKLAEGVIKINRKRYSLLSRNAVVFSKKYSSQKTAKLMIKIYQNIINKND